ncbi:AMP-binding protein [Solidesulfovibrio sp.]
MPTSPVRDIFQVLAARSGQPHPVFLFSRDGAFSPDEACTLTRGLARAMLRAGLAPGGRLMLLAGPGPVQIGALLAAWRLGVLIAPVDRFAAPAELARLTDQFRPDLAVIEPELAQAGEFAAVFAAAGVPCLDVAPGRQPVGPQDAAPLPAPPDVDAPALCIFTSGSTGLPKGVLLSQRALLAGADLVAAAKALTPRDRALCVLPLSHLNGIVTTLLAPLLSGGATVFAQETFSARGTLALLDRHACTWFSAVPTHYALLLSPPVERSAWSLATVRFCRSASAPLPARVLQEFEAHYGVAVIETMGTTETAGQIFSNPLPPAQRKPGSIGLPVGFEAVLRAEDGSIVTEPDVPGEIEVRGPALMSDYLDDPAETAKAVHDGWLRTGDMAVRDADGYFFIRGRKKDIAIYCGLNISLRAIDAAIIESGLVADAACVGREHPVFGETVTIYAIALPGRTDQAALAETLIALAAPHLPNRQAAGEVIFVADFPRSAVGKVLKGRLGQTVPLYRSRRELPADAPGFLAAVLGVAPDSIRPDLRLGSIPAWDSLAYVAMLAAMETVIGRRLSKAQTAALVTYEGVRRVLAGLPVDDLVRPGRADPTGTIIARLRDAGYGDAPVTYLMMGYERCLELGVRDVGELVQRLTEALPAGRHLVMNSFSWKFCGGAPYHYRHTPGEVGIINEVFRQRPEVVRGPHPIYAYLGCGPDAAAWVAHAGDTCWGEGSATWRLLTRPGVRAMTFGLPDLEGSPLRANPALHAVEQAMQAPYRFFKEFAGLADFGAGMAPYATRMYVRELDPPLINTWLPIWRRLVRDPDTVAIKDVALIAYRNAAILEIESALLAQDPYAVVAR